MKIKKTSSKKLTPLPGQLRKVIKHLEESPEEQIPDHAEDLSEWRFPRGDFFHWIPVLDRFDAILERICADYNLEGIQTREFDPTTKRLIIAIANVSRTLFENCTNRHIYNSYEHLNALLNTTDIDVLETALRFMLRPAQRVSEPRQSRINFIAPQEKITELARGWSLSVDIAALCKDNLNVTNDMTCLKLQFYRTRKNKTDTDESEGVNVVTAQLADEAAKSDIEVFQDLVKQHNIPPEYHFELANRIRIAKHITTPATRKQLLIIQLISTAIMAHTVSETTAQNRVFVYEPHLVTHLTELVHPEQSIPLDIQAYALYALDAISRHMSKLTEVLSAFNASANHGALLCVLRQIHQQDSVYSQEFLAALFALLGYLLQTNAGGQMFMSAGIIPILLQTVENTQSTRLKNVTKVVGLLDFIINTTTNSFTAFCNANGVDILLARIKTEVLLCIDYVKNSPQELEVIHGALAPHERLSLLKTMLKFLLRMMESSGSAEGLRNLIDSSAPASLKLVMENPKIFGNVLAPAINIVTTLIHSEPTSLPILQEQGLPQAFLHSMTIHESPGAEVLMSFTHAFGSICLNTPGLEMFNEAAPLPRFFDLMTAPDNLHIEDATMLGTTFDELIRHHPSLKPEVFRCVDTIVKKVITVGHEDAGKPSDNSHLLQLGKGKPSDVDMTGEDTARKSEEDTKSECLLVSYIDLVSRFLEGLFQNQSNVEEFAKANLPSTLLDYYALPMLPADFSVSIASDSLAYLFRMISEISPLTTVRAIAERVKQSIQFIVDDARPRNMSMVSDFIDVKEHETEKIERGNKLLRSLIQMYGYVNLLSNICCTTVLQQLKNPAELVKEFIAEEGHASMIHLLGKLHRTMVWENILLRESVPKSWYSLKSTKKSHNSQADNPLGISGFETSHLEDASRVDSPETSTSTEADKEVNKVPDPKDPRIINIKHFKTFLGEIPPALMPVFQGLTKVLANASRRTTDISAQREQLSKLSDCITRILVDNIVWPQVDDKAAPPACRFDYFSSMFSMISFLLVDEQRSQASLMVPLATAFNQHDGVSMLIKSLDTSWSVAEEIESVPAEERTDKSQDDLLARIDASLELLLAVLLHLGSPKLLSDAHFSAPSFEPREWIVSMHLKLSAIKKHLHSPQLHKFPKFVLHTYLKCITQLMNGEGEVSNLNNTRLDISTVTSLPSIIPIRRRVEPDQNRVQLLTDMGFDRARAERALVRCNNDITRATDYILNNPMPMVTPEAGSSAPPPSDNPSQGGDSSQATSAEQSSLTSERQTESSDANNTTSDREMGESLENDSDLSDSNEEMADAFPTSLGQRSLPRDEVAEQQPVNKGKERAQSLAEAGELRAIREELRLDIPGIMLSLAEKREDLVFHARDLLVVLCKDDKNSENAQRIMSLLMDRIDGAQQQSMDSTKLCTQLRLMALLLREKSMQSVIQDCSARMLFLFDMIVKAKDNLSNPDTPLPNWLASVLLVLEIFISQTDDPQSTKTDTTDTGSSSQMSIDSDSKSPKEHPISADQRGQLLQCCVSLLKKAKLSKDDIFAVLRIVVRLTKHNTLALQFVEIGGLEQLFNKPRTTLEGTHGQKAFIILILRHIIEDKTVLEESMTEIIKAWNTSPRPRNMDIETYLRTNGHVALREPSVFLQASEALCRLTKYSEHEQNRQIKIINPDSESTDPADTASDAKSHTPISSEQSTEPRIKTCHSNLVIHHILNELMTAYSSPAETDETKKDVRLAYTGFLLQCLVELVSSYSSCKYDIYQYSRRRNSKDGGSGRPRHSILSLLINDLLPFDAINPAEEESRKQQGLSIWTTSVLVAMCYDASAKEEAENGSSKSDLTTVRKYVLEGMVRSFKDAIASTDTVSIKYNKYLALAELCQRILNAPPNLGSSPLRSKEGATANIAKIMLEKNFVPVLTSAISDVDVNYPHAKNVLTSLLRPLEQLTKAAIKIEPPSKDQKKEDLAELMPRHDRDVNEEAPDLYRNSSLGMFNGSVMDEDDLDELGTSEEEEGVSFDEEDFDEDTGSDLSDMSEEDEDDDVDQEMDVMMHHHHPRYNDTDMEEAEDEDDEHYESGSVDQDDGRDDEDGSISGVTVDSEESEDEDDGQNFTWHLEDIYDEDGPIRQGRTEIEIDTEDEQNEPSRDHRHNASHFEEGQEEDLDTLDQSEFDDEGSDGYEEGHDAEFNDSILLDEEDLGDQMISDGFPEDDILFEDVHRPRSRGAMARRQGRAFESGGMIGVSGGQVDILFGGAGSSGRMAQDDIIDHPLLRDSGPSTSEGNGALPRSQFMHASSSRRHRMQGMGNLRAFEDIIGGSAVQILENIVMSSRGHNRSSAWVGTLEGGRAMPSAMLDGRSRAPPQEGSENRDVMSLLHDFHPMATAERWRQEGRMMYGDTLGDKALGLANSLFESLIPFAQEEKKKRDENERRVAEEVRKKKEEDDLKRAEEQKKKEEEEEEQRRAQEERQAAERAAAAAAAATTTTTTTTATTADEHGQDETVEMAEAGEQGEGSGTANESAPTERTTITIHGESVDISGTGIDIEFLEALPDDLREEVVNQHMRERRSSTHTAEEDIPREFLEALPPDIREEGILAESRRERQRQAATSGNTGTHLAPTLLRSDAGLSTSLDALVRSLSARPSEGDDMSRFGLSRHDASRHRGLESSQPTGTRKPGSHHDAIQLVDRTQLATLVRLLFIPQTMQKNLLNRLLQNLCENSKTRSDLLSLLICILQDGSVDLAAVDKSFTQLSLYPKGLSGKASSSKTKPTLPSASVGENVPNLITQRCLEVLLHVVQENDQSLSYFLTENDCLAGLKRTSSKKGKGKEKPPVTSKYPLLVLMSLLDRPIFVENTNLMEQLTNLLSTMCRPFPLLVKKYEEKMEARQQLEKEAARPEDPATASADSTEKSTATISKELEKPVPKPPAIPDHYLKMVVQVLTSGECSSKAFRSTVGAITHLSALDGALQTITHELMAASTEASQQICKDLEDLLVVLRNAMAGTEVPASALALFSTASSHQAKLLRVLKTVDHMYSHKQGQAKDDPTAKEKEKRVLQIYEELDFLPLWKKLGQCLSVIHEKEELINVATVLLPLIESFMVVSKYVASKGQGHNASVQSPTSPTTETAPADLPDDFFFAFTEDHKKILNIMVRNNPNLMSGSFSLLVHNPKMLEFDNKRNYFVTQLHKRAEPREHYPPLQLKVRRQYVFEDSYHQLQGRLGNEIKYGKLVVQFYNEEGVDAGGVSREWFSVLARQMFDPNYALFITSAADKLTYQPNRASSVNQDHLSFFKFVGRVIGKAIYDGRLLDAYFTRSFYKHLLGRSVDYRDVEAVDPEYYKSLVWMLENDITDVIDLTFSLEMDDFGKTKTIDLIPNGRNLAVTEENKHEYVNLVTAQKLTIAIKDQINAFLNGFHDIIPASLIQIFNEQELELLISGLPDIDIDDWKNNTTYESYTAASPQIQWFWRAVRSFDQEERAKLLQFATGTSKVPLEGFAHLQGSGGVQKFQIHKDFGGDNRLPSAHTCFNQVDLPQYDSYESLRSNLFKAISECSTGFSFV